MTTPNEIREYVVGNSPWVDHEKTVDTIKSGNGDIELSKVGVCWFPSMANLQAAHEAGCQLLICHEPVYYDHFDSPKHPFYHQEPAVSKRKFLEESGLVLLRLHDTWDNWPGIGIRDSWAAGLGLDKRLKEGSVWHLHGMYEIKPQPLREFAQDIAGKIKPLGEDSVQVIGDPDRIVSRPALGVGCIGPDKEMVDAGADVLIVCYDGGAYWCVRERLAELGAAIITVEHGTSEMWGLENLGRHLAEVYPDLQFQYFDDHPRTWTVKNT